MWVVIVVAIVLSVMLVLYQIDACRELGKFRKFLRECGSPEFICERACHSPVDGPSCPGMFQYGEIVFARGHIFRFKNKIAFHRALSGLGARHALANEVLR